MSNLFKRAIVLIATLTLAGMAVGCDSNSSSLGDSATQPGESDNAQQGTLDENEPIGQLGSPSNQEQVAGTEGQQEMPGADQQGEDPSQAEPQQNDPSQMAENESQPDPSATGEQAANQDEMARAGQPSDAEDVTINQTRDSVSAALGIPESAVIVAVEERQAIMEAPDEFEREARVTASTVQNYLGQIDESSLSDRQQAAYQELESGASTLDQDIEQFAMAEGDQRDALKSQVEERLNTINENWKNISDQIDFSQSATGGGPEEGLDSPMEDDLDSQPEVEQPGDQPADQNSGETETY